MLVLIETPYNSTDPLIIQKNLKYLTLCMELVMRDGDTPIASHLIGPLLLQENDEGRQRGLAMRAELANKADEIHFFIDLGWSPGMQFAWDADGATRRDRRHTRRLPGALIPEDILAQRLPRGQTTLVHRACLRGIMEEAAHKFAVGNPDALR